MKPQLYNDSFSDKHTSPLVDVIITDPPYNISRKINCLDWKGNTIHSMKFDKKDDWDSKSSAEYIRQLYFWVVLFGDVLRPGGQFVSFCADRYISHYWDALEKSGINIKRVITWCKPNAVPFNRKYMFLSSCEYILWGYKPGKNKTFHCNDLNQHNYIIKPSHPQGKVHPNQKPLDLITYFVETLTNPGDLVFDPFMGSGTTGVACVHLGREFRGVEKDKEYFKIAEKRIKTSTPGLIL